MTLEGSTMHVQELRSNKEAATLAVPLRGWRSAPEAVNSWSWSRPKPVATPSSRCAGFCG